MPVLSWAHSAYWQTPSTAAAPTAAAIVSYPRWMTTITVGSGLGGVQGVWETWLRRTVQERDRRDP